MVVTSKSMPNIRHSYIEYVWP